MISIFHSWHYITNGLWGRGVRQIDSHLFYQQFQQKSVRQNPGDL